MKVTREELMGASIHLLEGNLSARALNILAAAEIRTVEQLIAYEPRELRKFRNCGRKTINELRSFLAAYQLD
jgi:DNA-directed RNA polymerase alpha subunit